jgi:hypothetical protein
VDQEENKMTADSNLSRNDQQGKKWNYRGGASAPVYGIGLIGAWVYYFQHATTFVAFLLGFLKGIVWPALVVYKLLEFLKL